MSALADISATGPVLVTGKKKSALDREARAYLSLQAESQRERSPPAFDGHVSWCPCHELRRRAEGHRGDRTTSVRSRQSK
jgi:hypothetical protein